MPGRDVGQSSCACSIKLGCLPVAHRQHSFAIDPVSLLSYHRIMVSSVLIQKLSLLDLATTQALPGKGVDVVVEVPDAYLSDDRFQLPGVEGLAVQRLIGLAQSRQKLTIMWAVGAAGRIWRSPALYPLAAVAMCLSNAVHVDSDGQPKDEFEKARQRLLAHRLNADMFSEQQVLVCLDHVRPSLPHDLYDAATKRLRRDEEFEALVDDLLFAQRGAGFNGNSLPAFRLPLAVILRELIENTDDHAKSDFDGGMVRPNAIRGLMVKRIMEKRKFPSGKVDSAEPLPCLEFTIFDSGIGYYNSYRRQLLQGQARGGPVTVGDHQAATILEHALGPDVSMDIEYGILLKCLERHSDHAIPDARPGHRGMGLYEVLRALKSMQGMFEVRTGRLHGYRSFLKGELRIQLEPASSKTRPGMPKASLLDVKHKIITKPTQHDEVRGTVVRVVVPLT
jgi:hypothetical protein